MRIDVGFLLGGVLLSLAVFGSTADGNHDDHGVSRHSDIDTTGNTVTIPTSTASEDIETGAMTAHPPPPALGTLATVRSAVPLEHVGCFDLGESKAIFEEYLRPEPDLTPAMCFEMCTDYTYALVTMGNTCFCVNEGAVVYFLPSDSSIGTCDSPCAGDPSQQCGGPDAFDLYHEAMGTTSHQDPDIVGDGSAVSPLESATNEVDDPDTCASMEDDAAATAAAKGTTRANTADTNIVATDAETTTAAPSTTAPTTEAPTTTAPTTAAPTTAAPSTAAPAKAVPITAAPNTAAPTTAAPTTGAPTVAAPSTTTPTTSAPTTAARAKGMEVDDGTARFPAAAAAAARGDVDTDDAVATPTSTRAPSPGPTGEYVQRRMGKTSPDEDVVSILEDPAADPPAPEELWTSDDAADTSSDAADDTMTSFDTEGGDRDPSENHLDPIIYQHGCYAVDEKKDMFLNYVKPSPFMTRESCFSTCYHTGYQNFMVTQGNMCVCIDMEDVSRFFVDREAGICDAPCDGDASNFCGGSDAYYIYSDTEDHSEEFANPFGTPTAGDEEGSNKPGAELQKATVYLKTFWKGWVLGELSVINGKGIKFCEIKRGVTTSSCQGLALDGSTEIVVLGEEKGYKQKETDGERLLLRVTTGAPRGKDNAMWVLDMRIQEQLDDMVDSMGWVIGQSPEVEDVDMLQRNIVYTPNDLFIFGQTLGPRTIEPIPAFRGRTLSPNDFPLKTGQFLSTLPVRSSVNVEVTEVGDILLRSGDLPAYSDTDPLWTHRATGSIGGKANGGIGCVVESWWTQVVRGKSEDIPVNVSVKNGRWRVGRGWLCTMGRSPKPAGSWRAFIPGNARGKAIRAASLQLLDSGNWVVASGDGVFWDSSSPS